MKKLLLVRHAKASHDTGYSDFERPLKPIGIQDAEMMADRLHADSTTIPQVLVTSPAVRTLATANIFAERLSLPEPTQIDDIYEASTKTLLNIINELPDKYEFIGLVGHNPAVSDILNYLTGQFNDMPPGAFAVVEFEFDSWKMVSEFTGKLTWFSTPKTE
jgi:phosphohistidine phosphatase